MRRVVQFPHSKLGRVLAALWVLACVSSLVAAYLERETFGSPFVVMAVMLVLTFPAGLLASFLMGAFWGYISQFLGLPHDDVFTAFVPYWIAVFTFGCVQWFVIIPMFMNRLRRSRAAA